MDWTGNPEVAGRSPLTAVLYKCCWSGRNWL